MVDRVVGQLSLADGVVQSEATVFDKIAGVIDWGGLRVVLGERSGPGSGAASYPAEVLLRCLLLGMWHGLSDPALEAQVRDRLSFRRFAGLSLSDQTPDHTTLWRFREELKRDGLIDKVLFEINRQLEAKGLMVKRGTLVDASFLQSPARPPRAPKKGHEGPARPSADEDARWGRKGGKSVFGYKVHIGMDADHDLSEAGIKDRLMRRPNKHHPVLPKRQQRRNRLIAKVRSAVERPFAVFKERYGLRRLRAFNLATNRTQCVLAACAYNLRRALSALTPRPEAA